MKSQTYLIYLLFFLLVGCADPLPSEKMNYAGEWQASGVSLLILEEGSVSYHRNNNGANVEINAPLQKFEGDDFIVGLSFFNTRFDVTKPPHQDDSIWRMTVDGVELTRVR